MTVQNFGHLCLGALYVKPERRLYRCFFVLDYAGKEPVYVMSECKIVSPNVH